MTPMGLITLMVAVSLISSAAPLTGNSRLRSNTLEKALPSRYSNLISSKYSSTINRSWSGDLDSMKRSWSGKGSSPSPDPPPSMHMFGSLDLSLLEGEESLISFKSTGSLLNVVEKFVLWRFIEYIVLAISDYDKFLFRLKWTVVFIGCWVSKLFWTNGVFNFRWRFDRYVVLLVEKWLRL